MVFAHLFQWDIEEKVRVDVELETGTTTFTVVAVDVDHQIGHASDQALVTQDITSDSGADEEVRPAPAAMQDFVPAAPSSPLCSVGASIVPKVNLHFLLQHDQQNFEIFTVKLFHPALHKS